MSDMVVVVVTRLIHVLTSLLLLRVMTSMLTESQIGAVNLYSTITVFFVFAFISPIGMHINRSLHEWRENKELLDKLGLYLLFFLFLSFISFLLFSSFGCFLSSLEGVPFFSLLLIFIGLIFSSTFNNTVIPSFNMLGKRKAWMVFTILTLWVSLVASYTLFNIDYRAESWVLGQVFGFSVVGLIGYIYFYRCFNEESFSRSVYSREAIYKEASLLKEFSGPLYFVVGIGWLIFQYPRISAAEYLSLEFLGYYAVGYAVSAGVLSAFESTCQSYFYPKFYSDVSTANKVEAVESWCKYAAVMIPLTIYLVALVIALSKPLLYFLVDDKFHHVYQFVILGALIEFVRIYSGILSLALHGTKQTTKLILPAFVGGLITVISLYVSLDAYGEIGFFCALVFSGFLYSITMTYAVLNTLKVKLSINMPFYLVVGVVGSTVIFCSSIVVDPKYLIGNLSLAVSGALLSLLVFFLLLRSLGVKSYFRF